MVLSGHGTGVGTGVGTGGTGGQVVFPLAVSSDAVDAFQFYAGRATAVIRVLQISDDLLLAHSRQLILMRAGFAVQTISRVAFWAEAAIPVCHVVLLCQTVSPGEALAIAKVLAEQVTALPMVRISYPEDLQAFTCESLLLAPALPADICKAVLLSAKVEQTG